MECADQKIIYTPENFHLTFTAPTFTDLTFISRHYFEIRHVDVHLNRPRIMEVRLGISLPSVAQCDLRNVPLTDS